MASQITFFSKWISYIYDVENAAGLFPSNNLVKGIVKEVFIEYWVSSKSTNAGISSRPWAFELFTLNSNFLNMWILKSWKVFGSRSEIFLNNVSFSKLDVYDFEVPKRFLKCWNHLVSFSSLFAPFCQVGGTAFLFLISLIVFCKFVYCLP